MVNKENRKFIGNIIGNIAGYQYKDFLYVVLCVMGLFVLGVLTCTPREFTDDDWGIANYFAGALGADYATPYNKFINFIWGWIMYILYQLLPGPNWFIVVQEIIVLVSFAILQYMLIQKLKEYLSVGWAYLFSSVVIVSFEFSYICRLEFTQTATLGSIAGMMLMTYAYSRKRKGIYIGGIVLTIISSLHRFASFLMCIPFIAVVFVVNVLASAEKENPHRIVSGIKKYAKLFITITGIIVFGFSVSKINTMIYNSDYYAEYNAFNSARVSVLDYPISPYEDIADKLQEINVSKNDYALMTSWTFADLSFFTTDLFCQVAAIEPKESVEKDYKAEIKAYYNRLIDPKGNYNKLFYFAVIILVICIIIDFRHMAIYSSILLGGTILIEMYFSIIVKRFPSYCRTGLLFCLVTTALMITDYSRVRILQDRWHILVMALCVGLYLLVPLGNDYYFTTKGSFKYNMDGLAMYEYMNSREDDIFMVPTGEAGGLPALRNSYSIFKATKPGIMHHVVGLGGWSTNNPWVNEAYSSWGIKYPISQVADDNVYFLATIAKVQSIRTYLMEHHGMDTSASLSAIEYGTTIYKLTNNDMKINENKGQGSISSVECDYDGTYDTYDFSIEFSASLAEEVNEPARVYMSMRDSYGSMSYYMLYHGNSMMLMDKNVAMVKVPSFFINYDTEYDINIVVQRDGVNHFVCSEDACFIL